MSVRLPCICMFGRRACASVPEGGPAYKSSTKVNVKVIDLSSLVAHTGFEPVISALRGRCPSPLDECARNYSDSITSSLVYKANCCIIYWVNPLPSGVVVALVTLDHATLVRIQARQPIHPPILTLKGPIWPICKAKSATCCFSTFPLQFHPNPFFPTPVVGRYVGKNIADSNLNVGKSKGKKKLMPNQLTVKGISALAKPGRFGDGGGLYLVISKGGTKSWMQRITIDGRRRDIGLGGFPTVGLAKARQLAADNRAAVAEGRDPVLERRKTRKVPTFRGWENLS